LQVTWIAEGSLGEERIAMTFRILKGCKFSDFPAAKIFRVAFPAVFLSGRAIDPIGGSLATKSSTLRARLNSDGDCLRGLGVAIGIEASAVAMVFAVWSLVQMIR
jgi:hypothetical protein